MLNRFLGQLYIILALSSFLFVIMFFLQQTTPIYGQSANRWTEPRQLSVLGYQSWFSDIAVDHSGRIHVVWTTPVELEKDLQYDLVMYSTSFNGLLWSTPIDIAAFKVTSGIEATRPSIFVDQHGTFHMTCRYNKIFYLHSHADTVRSAISAMSPRRLTKDFSYYSRLVSDNSDKIHLFFTARIEHKDFGNNLFLFYISSTDGGKTWSRRININPSSVAGVAKPQAVIDSDNNIHLVWESGDGGSIGSVSGEVRSMYAASYDNGQTWTKPISLIKDDIAFARNVSIAVGEDDKLIIVWSSPDSDSVYYQISHEHGRSWSLPKIIPNVSNGFNKFLTGLDSYVMVTDVTGKIHLLMVGETPTFNEGLSLLHVTWNGEIWSSPEVIINMVGDVPEWPRAVIANGNKLHVTWFTRDEEFMWDSANGDNYKVWYSAKLIDGSFIANKPWPTPTPLPSNTPTATLVPEVILTPSPTINPIILGQPASPETVNSIYTDTDDIFTVFFSLLPSLSIIATVVLAVRAWRRWSD